MQQRKMILIGSLAALMGVATLAQADEDRLPTERLDEVLSHASDYGFQSIEEIDVKRGGQVDVEGWIDDDWEVEVRFSLDSGESLNEERKRRDGGAWGLTEEEVRAAMEVAVAEGMVEFEGLDAERDGRVDIEGYDADGRELEVTSRDGELLGVDYD